MAIDSEGKIKSAASSRGGFRGGFVAAAVDDIALEGTSQEILAAVAAVQATVEALTTSQQEAF